MVSGCSTPKNRGKAKARRFFGKVQTARSDNPKVVGFKVSAADSVGASVLCTEVSTGHPHPSSATKKPVIPFGIAGFFLLCRKTLIQYTNRVMRSTSVARSRRRKLQFIFPPFIWCKAGVFFKHSAKMRAGGKAGTFRYYIY